MTAVSITILFLVIGGFIAFAIMLQLKERARVARLRKIGSLNNQLRQVQRYLDDMPPQYQPKEMRLWLFSRILSIYDQLLGLQPDATLKRRRGQVAEEMKEFQNSKQKRRAKSINDEVLIIEVKRLFESFESFMHLSQREKTIDSNVSSRYIQFIQFFRYKIHADYHSNLARKAFLSGQKETALKMYKEALSHLAPIKNSQQAKPTIDKIKETIQEIEEELALQQSKEKKSKEMDNGGEEVLTDEWNKFIDESSFKEKKRF